MISVIGAGGQLGTAFVDLLGDEAMPVDRSELDLEVLSSIPEWVAGARPDVVVNCAAYTAVDAAEEDEDTALLINATAVGELSRACRRHGARFVTFSTDYVFDGTKQEPYVESDKTRPLSIYGRTKAKGERLALDADPEALVIRTSWLVSGTHPNFIATMLGLIRKGTVDVVDDQRGHPTFASDLAGGTMEAIAAGANGILHLTNQGVTTWFELARETAELAGLDPTRVRAVSTEEFPRPAPRPRNSVLGSERLEELGITPLPHYRDTLPDVVESLMARGF